MKIISVLTIAGAVALGINEGDCTAAVLIAILLLPVLTTKKKKCPPPMARRKGRNNNTHFIVTHKSKNVNPLRRHYDIGSAGAEVRV